MSRPKGFKHSEQTKRKLSEAAKGDRNASKRPEVREKIRQARKKQVTSEKAKDALRKHRRWIDGRTLNPEYVSWSKNQWHHRRRNADGKHSYGEWETLKAQYNWTCPCCKKREPKMKLSVDHIVPLSKGGSNNIENIQPLCRSCNCKKNNKTIKYPITNE